MVERTPDQCVIHCWGQNDAGVKRGSIRGQISSKCPVTTKFGRQKPRSECNASLGLRACRNNKGSLRGELLRNA